MAFKCWTGNPALDAIIGREIRYGQTRWTEVWLALIMTFYGAVLLAPGDTFAADTYVVIRRFVREETAGCIAIATGIARLAALWINGRRRETPVLRMLGCTGGFLFWTALSAGFVLASVAAGALNGGVALFPVLAIAELHASRRSGGDVIAADSLRFREQSRRRSAAANG